MKDIVISGYEKVLPSTIHKTDTHDEFFLSAFETRDVLGKKGTRNMDRLTGLSIHCIGGLVPSLVLDNETTVAKTGIVVGSAQGSMDSIVRFTHETLAHDRPDFVNPALFPNTVMNCAAGQAAIWHGLRGPNATISNGELSSLSALNYAVSLLSNGYVDTLIAGGMEELTEVSMASGKKLAADAGASGRFCEGGAFFVLEPRDIAERDKRDVIACLKSVSVGFNPHKNEEQPLVALINRVLEAADLTLEDITVATVGGAWPDTKEVEYCALRQCFGERYEALRIIDIYSDYGNGVSAHNALQLHHLIEGIEAGQNALLVAQDRKGNMGALVVGGE